VGKSIAPAGTVMRHPGIPMPFRRTMPDGMLQVFEPGMPVGLDSAQMEAVLDDIGHALVMVDMDERGRPRIDWDLTKSVRDNEKPAEKAEPPATVEVELSDKLIDLLELNADKFPEVSPVGVQMFLDEGGDLESLEGFTPELARELRDVLTSSLPDTSKLVEAGLDADTIEKLVANVHGEADQWLLDPVAIRAKVADGFKLESLDQIGRVTAKKILSVLEG
jgi:hypothetical protein